MSKRLHHFIRRFLAPTALTAQEKQFLIQFRSLSGSYTDFASILESYPDKKFTLLQTVNIKFKSQLKETVTSTSQALNLLGFIPSRNIVLYSILNKHEKVAEFSDKNISQLLSFASTKKGVKPEFQQEYFVAGLAFDIAKISLLSSKDSLPVEDINTLLEETWNHGMVMAKIVSQLQSYFAPKLGIQKGIVLDALLHDIGKVFVPFLETNTPHPSNGNSVTLSGQSVPQEKATYEYSHDVIGYLFLSHLGFVSESSKVVLHHHFPFLAPRYGNLIRIRTVLLWLADHIHKYRLFHNTSLYHPEVLESWYKGTQLTFTNCTREQFSVFIRGLKFTT